MISGPVLITGVAGQDGSYLAEALVARGLPVHGILSPTGVGVVPGVIEHRVDLADPVALRAVLTHVAPRTVFNLAGISSVARSWAEPERTAVVNGTAVATLLQACWELQERSGEQVRFLQAGSAEIFGNPETTPQNEGTPVRPIHPYGAAKAFAMSLVEVYRGRGLHASSVVLYNHESPRRPETFVTRKITAGVARIAKGEATELVLGNLDARRDWGWAPDYVSAMVAAVQRDIPDNYVIATGEGHTVAEFVAAAFTAAGIDDFDRFVSVDPSFVRPVDAVALVGDARKARHELGWRPTVGFTELVARMVQFDLTGQTPGHPAS